MTSGSNKKPTFTALMIHGSMADERVSGAFVGIGPCQVQLVLFDTRWRGTPYAPVKHDQWTCR